MVVIYKTNQKNTEDWQKVEQYKKMWGDLHPTTYDKLLELSRADLVDICLSAMSAMSDISYENDAIKKIKSIIQ